jgi:hypothetical protein
MADMVRVERRARMAKTAKVAKMAKLDLQDPLVRMARKDQRETAVSLSFRFILMRLKVMST